MTALTRRLVLIAIFVFVAAPLLIVSACGPDFHADVFVPANRPHTPVQYAKGHLGVLQPGYLIGEKVIAFRYLNGGSLNAEERAAWDNRTQPIDWDSLTPTQYQQMQAKIEAEAQNVPPLRWQKIRATYPNAPEPAKPINPYEALPSRSGWGESDNCTDSAYLTAIDTLSARARLWGKNSDTLKLWLAGQDAVFANCNTNAPLPAPVPSSAPLLLKQDNAYQQAAALLYTEHFDEAAAAFLAIAHDTSSPWAKWGDYLAGRTLIRKAAKQVPQKPEWELADFDPALMQQAAEILQKVVHNNPDEHIRHAAQQKLDFIAIRLHPAERSEELSKLLAGPAHDADFEQHLTDLKFLLAYNRAGNTALVQWLHLTGGAIGDYSYAHREAPDPKLAADALAAWQAHKTRPWLVAALQNAITSSPALMHAAEEVQQGTPGYLTIQYHRARLLIAEGKMPEARALLTHLLQVAQQQKDLAASNALLGLRMQTATDLHAWLADAPRQVLDAGSQAYFNLPCIGKKEWDCKKNFGAMQFDSDVAQAFNRQLSLSVWLEAAQDTALPANLQQVIARAGWTRAYVLEDSEHLRAFGALAKPALPATLNQATLFLTHAPGMRPYLEQGIQRSATYLRRDLFRDNWWCGNNDLAGMTFAGWSDTKQQPPALPAISFLSSAEDAQAKKEAASLQSTGNGVSLVGKRALAYVRSHPNDPAAADTLANIVNATHYGCGLESDKHSASLSKDAFRLLHARYPSTDAAKRTKYYY